MIYFGLAILISLAAGWTAFVLAWAKNRPTTPWVVASVVLVFPVLLLAALPAKLPERRGLAS